VEASIMRNVRLGILALLMGLGASPGWCQHVPSVGDIEAAKAGDPPAMVTLWNRPIIELRSTIGNLTPEKRAGYIRDKFDDIPYADLHQPVDVQHADVGGVSGLMVFIGGRLLFGVLPSDLDPLSGETLDTAAEQVRVRLREALDARREARRLPVLLRGTGQAFAATVAFVVFVWALVRLRLRTLAAVQAMAQGRELRAFGVDVTPYAFGVLVGLARLTSVAVGVFGAYLWFTFVLGQFPFTQPWSERLGRYLGALLQGLGVGALDAVPGFFAVLVIFFITRLVAQAAAGFFTAVERERVSVAWLQPETAKATNRLAVVAIWLFGITVAYPYIPGSETEAFKGVSVFAGLMISLGSAGLVNQVMSGLVVVYARALKPGDLVEAGDVVGVVSEVGLLSTKVITPKREEVTIPNAVMVGGKVTNYSKLAEPDGAIVSTTVTIGYDAPWRQVHELLLGAAGRTPGVRARPEPFVMQRALSDFYVEYELRFRIAVPAERFVILSVLHAEIQDAFNDAALQIMSPHFVAQPDAPVLGPRSGRTPSGGGA